MINVEVELERRYKKYAYLDSVAQFVLDVMKITNWTENYALARVVSSETYKLIKKKYVSLSAKEISELAISFCKPNYSISKDFCTTNESSEMLHFKLFCFESYIEAKGISEDDAVKMFVIHGVGTYLETCYSIIKTDNHVNVVLDIDIYIQAREKALQSGL